MGKLVNSLQSDLVPYEIFGPLKLIGRAVIPAGAQITKVGSKYVTTNGKIISPNWKVTDANPEFNVTTGEYEWSCSKNPGSSSQLIGHDSNRLVYESDGTIVQKIILSPPGLLCPYNNEIWALKTSDLGIYKSTDYGDNFDKVTTVDEIINGWDIRNRFADAECLIINDATSKFYVINKSTLSVAINNFTSLNLGNSIFLFRGRYPYYYCVVWGNPSGRLLDTAVKSVDGGANWSKITTTGTVLTHHLNFAYDHPYAAFVYGLSSVTGIYLSLDGGLNYNKIDTGRKYYGVYIDGDIIAVCRLDENFVDFYRITV